MSHRGYSIKDQYANHLHICRCAVDGYFFRKESLLVGVITKRTIDNNKSCVVITPTTSKNNP